MSKVKHIGIKFPFTTESIEKPFIDLDIDGKDAIKSSIMHLIFTPKGQRVRNPDFGTNLIQYIFNPDDSQTWSDIKSEIRESVSKFVPNTNIDDITISTTDNGLGLIASITYTVKDNSFSNTYQLITKLS